MRSNVNAGECNHCDHESGACFAFGCEIRKYTCCHCGRSWEQSVTTHGSAQVWSFGGGGHGPHEPVVTVTL